MHVLCRPDKEIQLFIKENMHDVKDLSNCFHTYAMRQLLSEIARLEQEINELNISEESKKKMDSPQPGFFDRHFNNCVIKVNNIKALKKINEMLSLCQSTDAVLTVFDVNNLRGIFKNAGAAYEGETQKTISDIQKHIALWGVQLVKSPFTPILMLMPAESSASSNSSMNSSGNVEDIEDFVLVSKNGFKKM